MDERSWNGEKERGAREGERKSQRGVTFMSGRNSCCGKIATFSYRAAGVCVCVCVRIYMCVSVCVNMERAGIGGDAGQRWRGMERGQT